MHVPTSLVPALLATATVAPAQGVKSLDRGSFTISVNGQRAGREAERALELLQVLRELGAEVVQVRRIGTAPGELPETYDPGHPAADARGYAGSLFEPAGRARRSAGVLEGHSAAAAQFGKRFFAYFLVRTRK